MTADPSDPSTSESVTAINVALQTPSDAAAFAHDAMSRLPTIAARPTSAVDERTATFIVVERFHLAIAIVTVIGSAVFLLALMVMLVEERRTTVGTLRLLGFTRRRILVQVTVEGALIAAAGAAAGILFAVVVQDAFNRFFQWRYDTTLIFLRITPGRLAFAAAGRSSRRRGKRHRFVDVASPADSPPGSPLIRHVSRISLRVAECRAAARAFAASASPGVAAIAALLFDMLLLSRGLVVSFGELLDRSGFNVRVLASDAPPFTGPRLSDAQTLASEIAALTGIEAVSPLRVRDASVVGRDGTGAGAAARGRRSCRPA